MSDSQRVLDFWLRDVAQQGWYVAVPAVDAAIVERFSSLWAGVNEGALSGSDPEWCTTPEGTLAWLILTDQFPRNMFRGDPRSFATDALARDAARQAVARGFDLEVPEPQRIFFYMPFEHSESEADQDWSVELISWRLPSTGADFVIHARAHRAIIRRFGRFPFRNAALARQSTKAEEEFLATGGYAAIVKELKT